MSHTTLTEENVREMQSTPYERVTVAPVTGGEQTWHIDRWGRVHLTVTDIQRTINLQGATAERGGSTPPT